jgi:hypothetical protein
MGYDPSCDCESCEGKRRDSVYYDDTNPKIAKLETEVEVLEALLDAYKEYVLILTERLNELKK